MKMIAMQDGSVASAFMPGAKKTKTPEKKRVDIMEAVANPKFKAPMPQCEDTEVSTRANIRTNNDCKICT